MFSKPLFFYNTDVVDAAGAEVTDATTQQDSNKPDTSAVEQIKLPDEVVAKLAEYEELKKWKESNQPVVTKTPEEETKEKEQEKADFIKYSVENDLFKIDELTQYETLSAKQDADLVWESFLKDFKEENPEITDENELSEEAKKEFNRTYKLDSENEKAKEKGLAKLAKDANEIRTPYKSKVESAQNSFKEAKQIKNEMPNFQKFVDEQIEKYAPEKLSFSVKSGDETIPVEIELTKEDKEAIAKEFKTHKTFYNYQQSKEQAQKSLEKKITGWIKVNKFEQALEKAALKFEGIGVAKGSNVGAENLYGLQKQKNQQSVDTTSNQAANDAANKARYSRR